MPSSQFNYLKWAKAQIKRVVTGKLTIEELITQLPRDTNDNHWEALHDAAETETQEYHLIQEQTRRFLAANLAQWDNYRAKDDRCALLMDGLCHLIFGAMNIAKNRDELFKTGKQFQNMVWKTTRNQLGENLKALQLWALNARPPEGIRQQVLPQFAKYCKQFKT